MNRESVELRVAGQTYRVVASADEDELQRLALIVEDKLRALGPNVTFHPQSMLLVAISLAHEVEEERARREQLEASSRSSLQALLRRVDAAIEIADEEGGEPNQPSPASP